MTSFSSKLTLAITNEFHSLLDISFDSGKLKTFTIFTSKFVVLLCSSIPWIRPRSFSSFVVTGCCCRWSDFHDEPSSFVFRFIKILVLFFFVYSPASSDKGKGGGSTSKIFIFFFFQNISSCFFYFSYLHKLLSGIGRIRKKDKRREATKQNKTKKWKGERWRRQQQ